jgi:hypothetical protein
MSHRKTQINLAWRHGGQPIVLLDEIYIIIMTTADPFWQRHNYQSWKHEKATSNLVGEFTTPCRVSEGQAGVAYRRANPCPQPTVTV